MGVDIHMRLIHKDGTMINKNMYDGRNSEWFDNLCGNGWDCSGAYDALQDYICNGLPECATDEDKEKMKILGYYEPHFITLADYLEWFHKYKPHIDAGWFSTYACWRIDNKHWYPEDIKHYLDPDDNINDWHFREVIDPYNCDSYVISKIPDDVIENAQDYILYFYFDR